MSNFFIRIIFAITLLQSAHASGVVAKERTLQSVQAEVSQKFKNVQHLTPQDFSKFRSEDTIIFDVREKKEFAVSHLKQAIRVDPDISTKAFLKTYAKQMTGKNIVFYCTVGVRSSILAEQVKSAISAKSKEKIYNLSGGIFRWHNEKRRLYNQKKSTDHVHPYNRSWGKLLSNQSLIRYSPEKE